MQRSRSSRQEAAGKVLSLAAEASGDGAWHLLDGDQDSVPQARTAEVAVPEPAEAAEEANACSKVPRAQSVTLEQRAAARCAVAGPLGWSAAHRCCQEAFHSWQRVCFFLHLFLSQKE